jgi:azurin
MTAVIGAGRDWGEAGPAARSGLPKKEMSTMRLFVFFLALFVAAPATPILVGASDPPRTITIVGTDDMKYSVTTITAKPGETIQVRLTSKGKIPKVAMAHNFVLLKIGTNIDKLLTDGAAHRATGFIAPASAGAIIAKTGMAGPGETVQVTFKVPDKPGRYPYICTFSGHYQAGMKGTLVVK